MKANARITLAIIAVLVIAGSLALILVPDHKPVVPVTIGQPPLEQSAFIYVAQDKGFFRQNGLNVTIRDEYPSGVGPVQDVLDGKLDLAVSAEYPVVSAALRGGNLSIIGSIDKYQNEEIIGRKDRGITNITDLKGKKIGYPKGTIVEFFLGRFLTLHGMNLSDVTLIDVNASYAADAIGNGEVDAIIYFEPHVTAIKSRLGGNAIAWPAQSSQLLNGVLSARNDWIAENPDTVRKVLISLADADAYHASHPDEVKAIVQQRLDMSDAYLNGAWPDHHFSLSLDQSLLLAMNDEGRWAISSNMTEQKTLPDFRNFIYPESLQSITPKAVDIR